MNVRASVDVKLDSCTAFQSLVDEVALALLPVGMNFETVPRGRISEGSAEVGKVVAWQPNEQIALEWRPATWQPEVVTKVELRFEQFPGGTRVILEAEDLDQLVGDSGTELLGWFAHAVAAPLLRAAGPTGLTDWITDRRARRPTGPQARETYRDPIFHRPNFKLILDVLKLRPGDYLVEVGCGGGAFLNDALKSGCKAAAIDHSPDMVRLAREVNRDAIEAGRLEIREAEADSLPFRDGTFTCAVMTGVFSFLSDPHRALSEIQRVLQPGGRLALFSGSKELRGTPAAPEPIASRLYFYEDHELEELAHRAGFAEARVERPDFERHALEAGVPEQALGLFSRRFGQLLLARK